MKFTENNKVKRVSVRDYSPQSTRRYDLKWMTIYHNTSISGTSIASRELKGHFKCQRERNSISTHWMGLRSLHFRSQQRKRTPHFLTCISFFVTLILAITSGFVYYIYSQVTREHSRPIRKYATQITLPLMRWDLLSCFTWGHNRKLAHKYCPRHITDINWLVTRHPMLKWTH